MWPHQRLAGPAQLRLLSDCADLKASPLVKSLFITTSQETAKLAFCWVEAFEAYRRCKDASFPVEGDASAAVLEWVRRGADNGGPQRAWPYGRKGVGGIGGGRYDFMADLGWVADGDSLRLGWTRLRADSLLIERSYLKRT